MKNKIEQILQEGVDKNIYPGCVFAGIHKGKKEYVWAGTGVSRASIYDIASLTKVYTSLCFLRLASKKLVNIDQKVTDILPFRMGGFTARMTFRHLLTCQVYFDIPEDLRGVGLALRDSREHLRFWKEASCVGEPGTLFRYANYPAFIIGEAIERITGEMLDESIEKFVFEPLGMKTATFNVSSEMVDIVQPTQMPCGLAYNRPGVVQDPMAQALLPKKVGIAGIFSDASDVLRLVEFLARGYVADMRDFLSDYIYQEFVRDQLAGKYDGAHRYGLGIDKFALDYIPGHEDFNRDAVVMSGATGTMLFALPTLHARSLPFGGVLLANAYPAKRDGMGHKPIYYLRKNLIKAMLEKS